MSISYRTVDYRSRRYKYPLCALSVLKVLADTYPVSVDVIFPNVPYTVVATVTSSRPIRFKGQLTDAVEVRVYGAIQVTAIFLCQRLEELPA